MREEVTPAKFHLFFTLTSFPGLSIKIFTPLFESLLVVVNHGNLPDQLARWAEVWGPDRVGGGEGRG